MLRASKIRSRSNGQSGPETTERFDARLDAAGVRLRNSQRSLWATGR